MINTLTKFAHSLDFVSPRGVHIAILCILSAGVALFGACTSSPDPVAGLGGIQNEAPPTCKPIVDEFEQVHADADVAFGNAVAKFGAEGSFDRVRQIKQDLDQVQKDYQLMSSSLCQALESGHLDAATYSRHRFCMDRALLAMRAMERVFESAPKDADPNHMAWLLESKMDWLQQSLSCNERAEKEEDAFPQHATRGQGGQTSTCPTTRGGKINGGALTLISNGAPLKTCQPIALQAKLLCQKQTTPGNYADLAECNGASLREGDRFKVEFSTNTSASLYFFLYNSAGQFQMFFPDKNIPNTTRAHQTYQLPPANNWITLDNVSNVLEHIQVVASTYPIQELEEFRGISFPPTSEGGLQIVASQTRGRIEPIATRGGRIEPIASRGGTYHGSAMLLTTTSAAPDARPPVEIKANGTDITAAEFTIFHTP